MVFSIHKIQRLIKCFVFCERQILTSIYFVNVKPAQPSDPMIFHLRPGRARELLVDQRLRGKVLKQVFAAAANTTNHVTKLYLHGDLSGDLIIPDTTRLTIINGFLITAQQTLNPDSNIGGPPDNCLTTYNTNNRAPNFLHGL